MRARRVFEEMSFQREGNPMKSMGIGVMTKFEEVFNRYFNHWISIPGMAKALYDEGVISKKGTAAKVAAFCVDLRKRGNSERPHKYKLYTEIGRSPDIADKLTLCKYAMACVKGGIDSLIVPIKIAIARNDQELFNRLRDLGGDKWSEQIAKVIKSYYSGTVSAPDWWTSFMNSFSAEDKINSGFLQEYKRRIEGRLERINRILGGSVTEEDRKWMKALERSNEYGSYNRADKNIKADF